MSTKNQKWFMGLSIQTEEPAKANAPNSDREETKSKNKQQGKD